MFTNSRDKSVFKHINRNIVHPVLNSIRTDVNKVSSSVEIIELNSDGEEINGISEAVFNTNNERYKKDYEENEEARENIGLETETYYDYLYKAKTNYSSNLIDIFTDLYSEICCDMDDNLSSNNVKCSKTVNNNISSNSSEDESFISDDFYRRNNHNKWSNYKKMFEGNGQTDCYNYPFDDYYFPEYNVDLHNQSTSKSTIEDEDNYSINRIPTPLPVYIPRLDIPLMPALPTVKEVAEPNGTLKSIPLCPKKSSVDNKSHTNSWMGTNESCRTLTPKETQERYFSWIPLVVQKDKQILKYTKTKLKNKTQVKHTFTFDKNSRNSEDNAPKTVTLVSTNVTDENNKNNNKAIQSDRSLIFDNEKSDKQVNLDHREVDPIETLNILIDSGEVKDNRNKTEDLDAEPKDYVELADCNLSNQTLSAILNVSVKSNTASTSIPSLHLTVVTNTGERRPWFRKLIKCFTCCR